MAVLAITIVAMIMLFVGTQTMSSIFTTRQKQERSVGMAAGDSGIEKYRAALQARLVDESNGWQLDQAALARLVDGQTGATVVSNAATSDAAGMVPALVPAQYRFSVREVGTDSIGYWQVFNVIPPRYLTTPSSPASNLVVYLRAWATSTTNETITTQPRIFRVEYRPTYMSDYQMVTDAPIFVRDNPGWVIDGPIHSNGYSVTDWLARDPSGTTRSGIWFERAPTCTANANFSTSQDAPIAVPAGSGCGPAVGAAEKHARQVSLLGVEDTYRYMEARCGTAVVRCFTTGGPYVVRLGNSTISVNGVGIPLAAAADSGSMSVLLDGHTTVMGALTMPGNRAGRVTIAVRRRSTADRQPRVTLSPAGGTTVGAATPQKDTVGIVTQGDIVLDHAPNGCLRGVNLAAISQSGSITLTPEFVTLAPPAVNLAGRECSAPVGLYGSFAGHGQLLASIVWPDVRTGGLTPRVGYTRPQLRYNRNLFRNPAPFFPTALPWGVAKVKDADRRCLSQPNAGDPRCE